MGVFEVVATTNPDHFNVIQTVQSIAKKHNTLPKKGGTLVSDTVRSRYVFGTSSDANAFFNEVHGNQNFSMISFTKQYN